MGGSIIGPEDPIVLVMGFVPTEPGGGCKMTRNRSPNDQFRGLPLHNLIGGPLNATPAAQEALARAEAEFMAMIAASEAPTEAEDQDPDA